MIEPIDYRCPVCMETFIKAIDSDNHGDGNKHLFVCECGARLETRISKSTSLIDVKKLEDK